jgi:hypothetical protein
MDSTVADHQIAEQRKGMRDAGHVVSAVHRRDRRQATSRSCENDATWRGVS